MLMFIGTGYRRRPSVEDGNLSDSGLSAAIGIHDDSYRIRWRYHADGCALSRTTSTLSRHAAELDTIHTLYSRGSRPRASGRDLHVPTQAVARPPSGSSCEARSFRTFSGSLPPSRASDRLRSLHDTARAAVPDRSPSRGFTVSILRMHRYMNGAFGAADRLLHLIRLRSFVERSMYR